MLRRLWQEEDGAKDLALWGVSAFLGTMFGPCLAGPLLAWLGHIPGTDHYSYTGYVALMACGGHPPIPPHCSLVVAFSACSSFPVLVVSALAVPLAAPLLPVCNA